jgi:hypothetical protein
MSRTQMEQNYIIKIHNTLLYMSEGMHNTREFGCMNGFWLDTWTHSDDYKVCWKKVQKFTISILIPVTQNPFYVYWPKHDFFEIHNGRGNFWPSKLRQYIPVSSQAHRVLNCFPKADELFIATELACESRVWHRLYEPCDFVDRTTYELMTDVTL